MSVSKMKKLTVFAHKRETDALVRRLMRLGCVQIERTDEGADHGRLRLERYGDPAAVSELEGLLGRTTEALDTLSPYSTVKKGLKTNLIKIRLDSFRTDGSFEKARGIVDETLSLKADIGAQTAEKTRLSGLCEALSVWRGYDMPLDFAGTEKTDAFIGTLPAYALKNIENSLSDTAAVCDVLASDKTTAYVLLTSYKKDTVEALRRMTEQGFAKANLPASHRTPAEEIKETERLISVAEKKRGEDTDRLRVLAKNIELVEILYDAVSTDITAEKVKGELASTDFCTELCGWIPEKSEKRVVGVLSKFGCAYEIDEPAKWEEPPVLLHNNFFAETFEWVLGMYSYPKYGTYDPTFVMSIFYFIIFGLMFADVGYGFLLTVCCFAAIKILNPRKSMRNFLAMFGYCGISSMIMGVLFGAYFSNMPQAYAESMMGIEGATQTMKTAVLFDPLADPMSFLILSLAVGAVHMICGMAINFIELTKKGKIVDALCDIATWWLTFAGIAFTALFPWGKYVLIAGLLSLVLTQGRAEKKPIMKLLKGILGIYGLVSYASDLLSYSRILALGLAAGVIGQVVNTMGTMGGPTVGGFIMMVIIFVVGHVMNLAINVLGTFVHTSRLQYIEFFGKFYEEGGKPFDPVTVSDKYTTEK